MSTTKTERALRDKINPQDDWMTFPLIKKKITSAKRCECNNYNLTSQAEEEEENDDDVQIRSTRRRTKKGPGWFNRNGANLPDCPTAPRKLQSIQDPNMMHNASSEDEAMSVQAELWTSSLVSSSEACQQISGPGDYHSTLVWPGGACQWISETGDVDTQLSRCNHSTSAQRAVATQRL
ncbi:hypothetical protein UPYG_G00258540 [Umbra pygmaea]|uniref:Uncharacterized protein n=1 Tax=Umbra pygmaea TaxID=75934 RepID=A0ABD0WA86_UMBPY